MSELTKEQKIEIIKENINHIDNKTFNIYFFVLDTKGNPSGSLEYIYDTAYILHERGYKVAMLHQEEEFIGVTDWLGEKYGELTHYNIDTDNVELKASDFLVIPEILSNVMVQTKQMPCKRILLVQNYNYLGEFMPMAATPDMLNVHDIITTTATQSEILNKWFPRNKINIVEPYIKNIFRKQNGLKDLVINIVAKDQMDVKRIVKQFHWEYPMYKWVSFRDVRGMSHEMLNEVFNNSILTIWVDENTNFGYSALQAMKSGSIVLSKIPKTLPDWCVVKDEEGNKLSNSCFWFDHIDELPSMIASFVRTWTMDEIPNEVYENAQMMDEKYTREKFIKSIENVYINGLFSHRKNEFEQVLTLFNNNEEN